MLVYLKRLTNNDTKKQIETTAEAYYAFFGGDTSGKKVIKMPSFEGSGYISFVVSKAAGNANSFRFSSVDGRIGFTNYLKNIGKTFDAEDILKITKRGDVFFPEIISKSFQDYPTWNRLIPPKQAVTLNIDESEDDSPSEESEYLSPEWFNAKGQEFIESYRRDVFPRYEEFRSKFSITYLSSLEGQDILDVLFLNGNHTNLCYCLEFDKKYRDFGGIGGGNASKYGLYYSNKLDCWTTGSGPDAPQLTEEEAIKIGTEIRDKIVLILNAVANNTFNTIEDYKRVYTELKENTDSLIDKVFILKYLHIMFPDCFPDYYSFGWHETLLNLLSIPMDNTSAFIRMGHLSLFIKKCKIPAYVFDKVIDKYVKLTKSAESDNETDLIFCTGILPDEIRNQIYFGAPGTGKSYQLEEKRKKLLGDSDSYERVTFHPDYTYANFVGTYKPVPVGDNGEISYKFVAGPFMRMYVRALKDARQNAENASPHLLIIEEINRANVAGVFGDVFQLLDRKDNISEYPIMSSEDVKKYLSEELGGTADKYSSIRLPDNLFIWATMNSADQGVFPMDTAFKRRWSFNYIGIDQNEKGIEKYSFLISGKAVNWNRLRKSINDRLTSLKINEDKLLGPYFINEETLMDQQKFIDAFKNKVIMYLFEDAAKQYRERIFAARNGHVRYSQLCEAFDTEGIKIFVPEIYSCFDEEDEAE